MFLMGLDSSCVLKESLTFSVAYSDVVALPPPPPCHWMTLLYLEMHHQLSPLTQSISRNVLYCVCFCHRLDS